MNGWHWLGFVLALAVLAACGIKGEPAPPEPDTDVSAASDVRIQTR